LGLSKEYVFSAYSSWILISDPKVLCYPVFGIDLPFLVKQFPLVPKFGARPQIPKLTAKHTPLYA
jgi:hypothetical protein